jgi:hypothetical protein
VNQKEIIKGFEGVGLIGTKHTHAKEFEHLLRPKASGTTKVAKLWERLMNFMRRTKLLIAHTIWK